VFTRPPYGIDLYRISGSAAPAQHLLGFALPDKPDRLRYFDTTFFGVIRLIMVVAILRQKPLLIPPECIVPLG
jgi:hypothetical protein